MAVQTSCGSASVRLAPTLLALPQCLLGPLMFGDVGAGAEPLDDVARGVPDWDSAGGEPAILAFALRMRCSTS